MAHKKLATFSGTMDPIDERTTNSKATASASRAGIATPLQASANTNPKTLAPRNFSATAFSKAVAPPRNSTNATYVSPKAPFNAEPPLRLQSPAFPKTTTPLEAPAQALRRVSLGTTNGGRNGKDSLNLSFPTWNSTPLRKQSKIGFGEKREGGKMADGEGKGGKAAHKLFITSKPPSKLPNQMFAPQRAAAKIALDTTNGKGDDHDDDPDDLNLDDPFYLTRGHESPQKARESFTMSGSKDDGVDRRAERRHVLNRKTPTPEGPPDLATAATDEAKGGDASTALGNKLGEAKMDANGKVQTWLQKLEEPTTNRISPTLVTPDLRKRKHFDVFGLAPSNGDAQDAPRAFKRTRTREASGGTVIGFGNDDPLPEISLATLAAEREANDRADEVLGLITQDDESEAESFKSALSTKPATQDEAGSQLAPAIENNAPSETAPKPVPGRKKGVAHKVPKKKVKFDESPDEVKEFYHQMPVSDVQAARAKKEKREEEGKAKWGKRVQTWETL